MQTRLYQQYQFPAVFFPHMPAEKHSLSCFVLVGLLLLVNSNKRRFLMGSLFQFLASCLKHMFRSWLACFISGCGTGGLEGVEGCRCQAFRCFAPPGGKDWQFALNHATCIMLSVHVQRCKLLRSVMSDRVDAKVIFECIFVIIIWFV